MIQQREVRVRLGLCLLLGILLTLSPFRTSAADVPQLPEGLATPGQLTPMPVFELPDPDGNPVRSEDLRGKVVVVRFWATW
jgi:cytochrome oxidase Cu insertion factor (SCO1/SenC/PrrC family)